MFVSLACQSGQSVRGVEEGGVVRRANLEIDLILAVISAGLVVILCR
jgi:hypothetical protein